MQNDKYLEELEKKSKMREEKKRKEKEMKVSGKSVLEIGKIMKEKHEKKQND